MKKSDYVHLSNKSIMAYFNVLIKINTHNLHIQIMLIFEERKKKNHITYISTFLQNISVFKVCIYHL